MTVTAAPDTCPACGAPYALANPHGAFKCDSCGHGWRVTRYSAWICLLCAGSTGKRVGAERVWLTCTKCGGTGMQARAPRTEAGIGGQCRGNKNGTHSKVREDGPNGEKWQCKLCFVRW